MPSSWKRTAEKSEKTETAAVPPLPEIDLEKASEAERAAVFASDDGIPDELLRSLAEREPEEALTEAAIIPTLDEPVPVVEAQLRGEQPSWRDVIHEEMATLASDLRKEIATVAASGTNGISTQMVGGVFDCPVCGLRIQGPSMTAQKGGFYEHPFGEAPKLGGKQCELKGVKFKPPVVFLQFATPRPPLTRATE